MRRLLIPSLLTLAMLVVLLGLGTWQVERLHWKEGVLADIARAEAAPPVPLDASPLPYSKVTVSGRLRPDLAAQYGAEVRDIGPEPEMGSFLIEPLERPDASTILVERGWVPQKRPAPSHAGTDTIVGFVRPGDKPGWFSANDDPAARTFFTLDPQAIAAALGLHNVAPFVLVALGPTPPEHYPDPAKHLPRPPNNHLSYAITWYGLAAALVVIFVLWARKALNE